jgi:hypothetical protein
LTEGEDKANIRAVSSSPALTTLQQLRLIPGLSHVASARTLRRSVTSRIPGLDALLGGGLPCGVTELVGAHSSGRTTLVYAVVAALTSSAGELVAWIDLPNAFDPEYAGAAGIEFARLLWIRPPDLRAAFRATEHVLDASGFRLVVLDLAARHRATRTPSPAVWLRLGRAATRSEAAVVVVGDHRSAGVFATLSLEIARRRSTFSGVGGPCPLFDGIAGVIRLRKSRFEPLAKDHAWLYVAAGA